MPHVKNTAKGDGTPDFEVGHGDAVGVGVESESIKKGRRNASIVNLYGDFNEAFSEKFEYFS